MSNKNKLGKFADIHTYPHVYENFLPNSPVLTNAGKENIIMKGQWKNHFNNNNPIVLELACGRGEYTYALAQMYRNKNFIGVDIKGARIWEGATKVLKENVENAAFLRTRIENINHFFVENEVEEIWITFPDPFLRESKENKRLTSSVFLDRYKKFITKGAILHLKTDNEPLYQFTLETLQNYDGAKILYTKDDIYASELAYEELKFKTYYEKSHLQNNLTIKYIRFTIN